MLRGLTKDFESLADLRYYLKDVEISLIGLAAGAPLAGKTLADMELRKKYGITVLAVRRDSEMLFNPEPDMELYGNDLLIVLGAPEKIAAGGYLFSGPEGRA